MLSENYFQRKCLVTGAGGFIGSALVAELEKQGADVRALFRRSSSNRSVADTVVGCLGSDSLPYSLLLSGVDTVFHLANTAHIDCAEANYRSDSDITINLAKEAQAAGVRCFIYVSSTKAAAEPGIITRNESWDALPVDDYGRWKRVTENRLLEEVVIPHIVIIRPCLVYGPGVKGNLSRMIRAIKQGYFPPLPETGAERSMVSVQDIVAAMLLVATNPLANRNIFIAADNEAYTAQAIYSAIRHSLGMSRKTWSLPLLLLKLIGFVGDFLNIIWRGFPVTSDAIKRLSGPCAYSPAKLMNLGWRPTTTFYKSLPEIISAQSEC